MKDSQGTSGLCHILKSFSNEVGVLFCCHGLPNIYKRLDTEIERKMMEIKRNSLGNNKFRSIDSIILKFPQIRDGLKEIRGVFEKFGELGLQGKFIFWKHYEKLTICSLPLFYFPYTDEDSNGTVDHEELKKCSQKLQFHVREEDIDDLFYYCSMNENKGIQFNEFIVLLCLIYLLKDCSSSFSTTLKMELPQIDATFNTIIEVFLFLDKNGEGKLKKKDVVKALNEASPWEKSPSYITRDRFKEMDLDRNGKISFRKFLFAFIKWVGIDSDDDDPEIQN